MQSLISGGYRLIVILFVGSHSDLIPLGTNVCLIAWILDLPATAIYVPPLLFTWQGLYVTEPMLYVIIDTSSVRCQALLAFQNVNIYYFSMAPYTPRVELGFYIRQRIDQKAGFLVLIGYQRTDYL